MLEQGLTNVEFILRKRREASFQQSRDVCLTCVLLSKAEAVLRTDLEAELTQPYVVHWRAPGPYSTGMVLVCVAVGLSRRRVWDDCGQAQSDGVVPHGVEQLGSLERHFHVRIIVEGDRDREYVHIESAVG